MQSQPKGQMIPHDIHCKPWEVTGVDTFQIKDKHFLCIEDYFIKFSFIKYTDSLSAECLLACCTSVCADYG